MPGCNQHRVADGKLCFRVADPMQNFSFGNEKAFEKGMIVFLFVLHRGAFGCEGVPR